MSQETPGMVRQAVVAVLICWMLTAPVYATCGGGGGGGSGGIAVGGAAAVYYVPWAFVAEAQPAPLGDLIVYWFPTGPENAERSSMRESRDLVNWSGQCVGVGLVPDSNGAVRERFEVPADEPMAVVVTRDGQEVGRVTAAAKGRLQVAQVEKIVGGQLTERSRALKGHLKSAKLRQKEGDEENAARLYGLVAEQGCLFPTMAKKATKALKKMGREAPARTARWDQPRPDLRPETTARVVSLMERGLAAERIESLDEARGLYEEAYALDPNDPVVLRFLGELHRHHSGDWGEAQRIFERILEMPADRLSRAVALHGLGKMTIHGGDFEAGLAMFEASLQEYPLSLTYRNLAVYWNTEDEHDKAYDYVKKALALAPDEVYNQIFAATYLLELGRHEEALEIAARHEEVLAASYNLAAIYAQLGDRAKTFELLRRHFYEYEQYDAVRAKEMREARDDIVFARYHADAEFVKLTALADVDTHSYHVGG